MPSAAGSISKQISKFCRFLPSSTVAIEPAACRMAMKSPCTQAMLSHLVAALWKVNHNTHQLSAHANTLDWTGVTTL